MSDTKLKPENDIENQANDKFNNLSGKEASTGKENRGDIADTNPDNIASTRDKEQSNTYSYHPGVTDKANNQGFNGLKGFAKRKGATGLIIALILLAIGGPMALLPLGPIMFFENISRDLNDQVKAVDSRFLFMARNKLPSSDRAKALAGCSKLTIRCKFATLGKKQVEKLKYAGVEVEGDKAFSIRDRTVPKSYTYRGKKYSPPEWAKALKTDPNVINAQRTANNARYSSVSDKSFMSNVYEKFGISKRAPEVKGNTPAERVNALLDRAGTSNIEDLKFTKQVVNGKETGKYVLDNSSSTKVYTDKEVKKMQASIDQIRNAKPPSVAKSSALKALSVLGYYDLACSVKNMLGGATIAAKIATKAQQIQAFAPIAADVYKIKAGDATPQDAETVGKFFNDTDNRKTVSDLAATKFDSNNNSTNLSGGIATKSNPNYGKSALDSSLYSMSTNGGVAQPSETRGQFSLGLGKSFLSSMIGGTAGALSMALNLGSGNGVCKFVQNFAVRGAGLIVGIALGGFSGGSSIAIQVGLTGTIIAGMWLLQNVINSALGGNVVANADLTSNTVARGDMLWTGEAAALGDGAQARGMMPASASQITSYLSDQNQVNLAYDNIDKASVTNQLDPTQQFSFAGSFARSILSSITGMSWIGNIGSILNTSINDISGTSAFAKSSDINRFKTCDDAEYSKLAIGADVQCNVRYFMPADELNMKTDAVAAYMEKNYANPVTGLPDGYTPPSPTEVQNKALEFAKGLTTSFLPPKSLPNDYARFLEFCAYRSLPYGTTFQDGSAAGSDDWQTGKNCLKTTAPFNYFRVYTMDKTVQEARDSDATDQTQNQSSSTSTSTSNSGSVTWPLDKKWWISQKSDFLNAHTPSTGTAWGADSMGTSDKGAGIAADIGLPIGTPVYAMVGGTVTSTNLCGVNDGIAIKSTIGGKTLGIAYMHGNHQKFKVGDTVNAGDRIMDSGEYGCRVFGAHLHIGMAYDGHYICPQDVFLALDGNTTPDFASLVSKGKPTCGR